MDKRVGRCLFWAVFAALVCYAAYLRVDQIDLRPLHNDEGVNFYFFEGLRKTGYYTYSHENYHGPSYFYLSTLLTSPWFFGDSEFGVRSSAVLVGLLTLLLLLPLRKSQGAVFVIVTAALVALSSSLTFYSRYAIHETLFLFAGAWCAIALYLWWETERRGWLYHIGAALGLLVATKETFIITFFSIGCGALALGEYRRVFKRLAEQWQHVLGGALLAVMLVTACFTGGFQWAGGLREMLLAVPQWIGRNTSDTGHFKSFWYYTDCLVGSGVRETVNRVFGLTLGQYLPQREGAEPVLLFALLIPLVYLLSSPVAAGRQMFGRSWAFFRFTAVWGVSAYLAYSFVDYKTPWLAINITLPVLLCLGVSLTRLFDYPWGGKFVGAAACVIVVAIAHQRVIKYNFTIPYGKDNPYSYVHTRDGMVQLVKDLAAYRDTHPNAKILVGVQGYWPLPYYLRGFTNIGYEHVKTPETRKGEYDVMILDSGLQLRDPNWLWKYYRLSDVQESHTFFKRKKKAGSAP